MTPDEIKAKGDLGESEMNEWLMESGLSYIAICQARETFSKLFSGSVKRPDFLILLDSIGLISVDAKNLEVTEWDGAPSYTLSLDGELLKAMAFERSFRIPLWYAYRNTEQGETVWYWISALKAVEVGIRRTGCNGDFITIGLDAFAIVTTADDMAKLYTQRVKSYANIVRTAQT